MLSARCRPDGCPFWRGRRSVHTNLCNENQCKSEIQCTQVSCEGSAGSKQLSQPQFGCIPERPGTLHSNIWLQQTDTNSASMCAPMGAVAKILADIGWPARLKQNSETSLATGGGCMLSDWGPAACDASAGRKHASPTATLGLQPGNGCNIRIRLELAVWRRRRKRRRCKSKARVQDSPSRWTW